MLSPDPMHACTEKIGQSFSSDVQALIRHRYEVVRKYSCDADVLEVGPGQGLGFRFLRDADCRSYVGLEYSWMNISSACPDSYSHLVHGDAHRIPFKDNSFDVVACLAMIYYLDASSFIREATRVLRPGGKLIFCTSNILVPGFVRAPDTLEYNSHHEWREKLSKSFSDVAIFGGFYIKKLSLHRTRGGSYIKELAKGVIFRYKVGRFVWHYLRLKGSRRHVELPYSINEMEMLESFEENFVPESLVDFSKCRVVYVISTL